MVKRSYALLSVLVLASMVLAACGAGSPTAPATPAPITKIASANIVSKALNDYAPIASVAVSSDGEFVAILNKAGFVYLVNPLETIRLNDNQIYDPIFDLRVTDEGFVTGITSNEIFQISSGSTFTSESLEVATKYLLEQKWEFIIDKEGSVWYRTNGNPWGEVMKHANNFAFYDNLLTVEHDDAITIFDFSSGKPEIVITIERAAHPQFWNKTFFFAGEKAIYTVPSSELGDVKIFTPLCSTASQANSFVVYSWGKGLGGTIMLQNGGIWRCEVNLLEELGKQIKQIKLPELTNDQILGVFTDVNDHDILITQYLEGIYSAYDLDEMTKP